MNKKYRVTAPVTLDGEPAGPDIDNNYVSFVPGVIVSIIEELADGSVVAEGPSWIDGLPVDQIIDRSCLVEVVE